MVTLAGCDNCHASPADCCCNLDTNLDPADGYLNSDADADPADGDAHCHSADTNCNPTFADAYCVARRSGLEFGVELDLPADRLPKQSSRSDRRFPF